MGEDPLTLLFEYLDASLQPTFVLQLSDTSASLEDENPVVTLKYTNPALQRLGPLHTTIVDQAQQKKAFLDLIGRLTSTGYVLSAGLHGSLVSFCGIKWTTTVVGRRWLVLGSTEVPNDHVESHSTNLSQTELPATTIDLSGKSPTQVQTLFKAVPPLSRSREQKPPLGTVLPRGHLGDLGHLERMRQFDWSSSPCGPIEHWPTELRHACEFALATSEPVCIFWGDEYTLVYNKGYADIIGEKHPRVMGRPFSENFQSVWPVYEQIFREIKESGQSVKQEKLIRMLVRDGCLEEVFFNFILAPILGADGSAAGISLRIHETTQQVVFERRLHVLTSVNKAMATTYNLHDLCAAAAGVLHDSTSDIHFAAIYSTDMKDHSLHLVLEGTAGLKEGYDGIPPKDDPQVPQFGLNQALLHAFETREPKVLSTANNSLTQSTLSQLEEYGVQTPCQELVIQPLKCYIEDSIAAVIVVGTSPLRKFDEDYRTFLQLMTRQIENGISVVRGIEREKLLHKAKITSEIEGRFWRFAEKAPVGMYMYNPDDVLTFSNSAFELMVGRSGEELARPMAWLDTVHPDSVADVMKVWKKYRQSNCDEAISFEIQFKKPWTSPAGGAAGSLDRTWALGTVHPEYTEDGKLKGTLGCITDISSVKWAEKIQTTRLSEAIEQKRQQENFLDVTSHEMRNPLNAIFHCASELTENIKLKLNNSDTSCDQIETLKESLDLATTITYCANHQKRIVDDVLTLSKLDARLLQVYPESTNPIKLFKNILELFAPEVRASGMNTNFKVEVGYNTLEVKRVQIDPHRVTQIVINLLSNAIKFTKKGKKRNLEMILNAHRVEPADNPMGTTYVPSGIQYQDPTQQPEWGDGEAIYLSFSVKDSGLGMTPEEASLLFQKFSQASPRTHVQFGGSGLGLYISRNLAELHGGRIGLSSQAGFGSMFEFYVKVRRSLQAPELVLPIDKPLSPINLVQMNVTSPAMQAALPAQPETATPTDPLPPPSQGNILIVEDNIINQRLLRKLITKHGYPTLTANNGAEALAAISTSTWNPAYSSPHPSGPPPTSIAIVLCDIEMPVMDGKTCVRRIRQLQREGLLGENIPVVAITGNARAEQVQEMRGCGFDDVVTKPYRMEELLGVVERFVGKGSGGG